MELAQRELRTLEASKGVKWEPLFFTNTMDDAVFERLKQPGQRIHAEKTLGVWKFDRERWEKGVEKPFHGTLRPDGGKL